MKTILTMSACAALILAVFSAGCAPDRSPQYISSFNVAHANLNSAMDLLRLKAQGYAQQWAEEIERSGKDDVEWQTVDPSAAETMRDFVAHNEEEIRRLSAPPVVMLKAHEKLVTQYRLFTDMAKLAENPGAYASLRSYWDRIIAVQSEYEALNVEISVLVPTAG